MANDGLPEWGSGNGSWPAANASTAPPWPEEDDDGFMEDYEYDLETAMGFFDWWELVPTLAVYAITMLLGVAGNALIIFTTARYRRMKSTTNVFLCSLASADLLLLLICIPVKVALFVAVFM
ncbi:hypothetical protein R5R35_011531 [Gryllus longicercus]|uniref:G-protein coupled receptors family 1 profile domain-containing protein n=1 Tax=Gryllus longicercus TaxID=2509291 RepID=A0AAN9Z8H2_9ORTH